jgi:hypothetical protein
MVRKKREHETGKLLGATVGIGLATRTLPLVEGRP